MSATHSPTFDRLFINCQAICDRYFSDPQTHVSSAMSFNSERACTHNLVNLELGTVIRTAQYSPNEVADLNADMRLTNQRWLPV